MRGRQWLISILVGLALAAIQIGGLWPAFASAIPGPLGDNVAFVWNTWWVTTWHAPTWFTPMLFAPWGASLVLHTHTLLPSALAAVISPANVVLGTNLVIFIHLTLNAVCAWALAFRLTRRIFPSAVAAVAFAWSPYIGAHLAGHFNLIAAWVLPLTALLLLRSIEDGRQADALALGVAGGAIAYIDYYYALYAVVLSASILAARAAALSVRREPLARWQRGAIAACLALLIIDAFAIVLILATGGGTYRLGPLAISMRGVENPAAAAGLLLTIGCAVAVLPRLRLQVDRGILTADLRRVALSSAIAALLVVPIIFSAAALWRQGGYVSQTYFWRSAPAGVDLGTMVLGNPTGLLWGGAPSTAYGRLGIDAVERVAWLGPALLILGAVAVRARPAATYTRLWVVIAIVFGMWALGPRLVAFGRELHVFLPAVLLRYLPLASNARMPGRAIVGVYLAAAMLAAIGLDALLARGRSRLAIALAVLLVVDFLPRSQSLYRPDHPGIYDVLARQTGPGSVCELPMGLRDGFGEIGRLDMRVMYYQTIHRRPITGGFAARLDPRVVRDYITDPVLGVLLRLSGGAAPATQPALEAALAGESLRARGIRFIMLKRDNASADLVRYVERELPLRTVAEENGRTLFEVSVPINASWGSPSR